jgi:flagellar FliL protein
MDDANANAEPGKKKSSLVMTIATIAVLTLVGGGGGWFLGKSLLPKDAAAEAASAAAPAAHEAAAGGHDAAAGKEAGLPKLATAANGIVLLEPVITNLAYPSDSLVRLEVALMFKGAPEAPLAEEVHQDIMAYMRTVSLQQIQGPRGFQYLRDDLQERVDLRSHGRISKILFRTFVIE